MGYLCPKCDREVSSSDYLTHVENCKKPRFGTTEQDKEIMFGA